MDDETLRHHGSETADMRTSKDTVDLLAELQKAAEEHKRILERQSQLIRRLRSELKDVRR